MVNIGLIYFSNTDVTGKLFEAIEAELSLFDCRLIKHRIQGSEIIEGRFKSDHLFDKLHACDAIIFGSPTYMGGVSAQFKAFADATSDFWAEQLWAGKLAAGVTSGTGFNGDQSATLSYMQLLSSQHGMLWVSLDAPYHCEEKGVNRLGCHLGVTAQTLSEEIDPKDLKTARYLANLVYQYAQRFKK